MLTLIYERSVESLLSRSKRRFIFQKDNRSDLDESKVFFLFIIDRRGSIDLILGRFWRKKDRGRRKAVARNSNKRVETEPRKK